MIYCGRVSPLISCQCGHEVPLGRQHDAINVVDAAIAGLLVSLHNPLAVDCYKALQKKSLKSNETFEKGGSLQCTHIIVFGLEVEVDQERGPGYGGQLDVVVGHGAGDLPGHHVVQQHLLQHLRVLHQAGHQGRGQGLDGLIGRGKHCQGAVTCGAK